MDLTTLGGSMNGLKISRNQKRKDFQTTVIEIALIFRKSTVQLEVNFFDKLDIRSGQLEG